MATTYQISPFFRGGWFQRADDPGFVGEVIGSDATIGSDDVGKLFCLYAAADPKTRAEVVGRVVDELGVDESVVKSDFDWLLDRGFLIPSGEYDDAIDRWLDNGWRMALYFHEYVSEAYSEGDVPPRPDDANDGGLSRGETCLLGSASDTRGDRNGNGDLQRLPSPPPLPDRPVENVLRERATCRDFSGRPVTTEALSAILKRGLLADPGVVSMAVRRSAYFRVYPFVSRVEGLPSGIYEYVPDEHGVVPLDRSYGPEEIDELIERLIVGQSHADRAGVSLFVTIDFPTLHERTAHSRGLPTAYLLLSQMAQMALLAATALGVDTFQTAAFEDSHVASVLRTTRLEEGPGYVLTFGHETAEENP